MTAVDTITTYLDAAEAALTLIAAPEVAARWDEPSVLPGMTVGALAAHLGRSITRPALFLDSPDPGAAETVTAPGYFASFGPLDDRGSELNMRVVTSAVEDSAPGPAGVVAHLRERLDHLRAALATLPAGRQVDALSHAMPVEEYLRTRLVEFALHVDDLALSVGLPTPDLGEDANGAAIAVLVEIARLRHGDVAVLRALGRRERDGVAALRVL